MHNLYNFGFIFLGNLVIAFLFFFKDRKEEKTFTRWFCKVVGIVIVSSILMYSMSYFFNNLDYKRNISKCEISKNAIMVNKECYKPVGNGAYVKYDTQIIYPNIKE